MLHYVRPPLPHLVFRDGAGDVIPYGRRFEQLGWDGPDDTYSVTQHPERFTPLLTASRAIVEHLTATYDVSVQRDGSAVEVRPTDPLSAPLRFTFRDDPHGPWVHIRAGATVELVDMCGCDHCDEDLDWMVGEVEDRVTAVIDGRLREWLNDHDRADEDDDLFLAHAFDAPDGTSDSSGSNAVDDASARETLRETFKDVPPRWLPWALRHSS